MRTQHVFQRKLTATNPALNVLQRKKRRADGYAQPRSERQVRQQANVADPARGMERGGAVQLLLWQATVMFGS